MLGIQQIASYIPEARISNLELAEKFNLEADFIENKIGVIERSIKGSGEETSDLAVKALNTLITKSGININEIEVLVVISQNPDYNIPHVSGLVHAKAALSEDCATFDLSLGCSGYIYGLRVLQSFMSSMDLTKGVLITADPYSKIVDKDDVNTALLFADAATATLIGPDPIFTVDSYAFLSRGDTRRSLICENGVLEMNGRDIFNFAATLVPKVVQRSLFKAKLEFDDVNSFLFHQGSRYILDALTKRMNLDDRKVVKDMSSTGNTVSSSIPILLEKKLYDTTQKTILMCGFGVGLSLASCIGKRLEFE